MLNHGYVKNLQLTNWRQKFVNKVVIILLSDLIYTFNITYIYYIKPL
jgi:hypothetical protein